VHLAQPVGTPTGFVLACTDQVVHAHREFSQYPLSEGYRPCGQAACSIAAANALERRP
jgi:hypothetical protein